MPDASVDAVFVAEAIHWFDPARAVAEMARVLRLAGGVAVLYNRLDWQAQQEPWRVEADAALQRHRLPPDDVDPQEETHWRAALPRSARSTTTRSSTRTAWTRRASRRCSAPSAGSPASRPSAAQAALAEIHAVLRRRGVQEAELRFRTEITTAARKGAGRTT